jgi:ABC-type hemin transport system substrate-binding protein
LPRRRRATRAGGCGWLLLSLLAAAGCSRPDAPTLVDQVGHEVRHGAVHRAVALAPDVTEIAFAIGAGDRLVAATSASDFPPAARALARVGPDAIESVLLHRPDLVLATTAGNDPRVVDRLRALSVPVCTFDVTSLARLTEAVRLAGAVLGAPRSAGELAAALERRIAAAGERAGRLPRRTALYVVWWQPLIVAAPGTFHDDLLRRAGLDNALARAAGRYPPVDPELLLDPQLAVVVSPDEADVRATFTSLACSPAAARLRAGAVRVIWLPADAASRPGPRLVDALEALVAAREVAP